MIKHLKLEYINNLYTFLTLCFLLTTLKFFSFENFNYIVRYSPYDDNLYVNYAFNLINSYGTLEFSEYPLLKSPLFSVVISFINLLGIKYTYFLFFSLLSSAFIFSLGCVFASKNYIIGVITFCVIIFNPISISNDWFYIMREPISCILDISIMGLLLILFYFNKSKLIFRVFLKICLVVLFLLSANLREEDFIRVILFIFIAFLFIIYKYKSFNLYSKYFYHSIVFILLIIIPNILYKNIYSNFVYENTGVKLSNQLTSGEFPKFISNLRSYSNSDIRLVPIKYVDLLLISETIPEIKNIIVNLPSPNVNSLSCSRLLVCQNIAYPYLIFYFITSISQTSVNTYFDSEILLKNINNKIVYLCNNGFKECGDNNGSIINNFKFNYIGDFILEFIDLLKQLLSPKINSFELYNSNIKSEMKNRYDFVLGTNVIDKKIDYSLYNFIITPIYSIALILTSIILFQKYSLLSNILKLEKFEILIFVYIGYTIFRMFCLSYVAIFFGGYESRMMFAPFMVISGFIPMIVYTKYNRNK
jgi:hypothetical protein